MLWGGNYYGEMTAADKWRQKGKLGRGWEIKKMIENKIKEENKYIEQELNELEDPELQIIAEADNEEDIYK